MFPETFLWVWKRFHSSFPTPPFRGVGERKLELAPEAVHLPVPAPLHGHGAVVVLGHRVENFDLGLRVAPDAFQQLALSSGALVVGLGLV
jgi:hypothetical protein